MDWSVTSPPTKTSASYGGVFLDVIAIRVPVGDDFDPELVQTEFLLAKPSEAPEWVPMNLLTGVSVKSA